MNDKEAIQMISSKCNRLMKSKFPLIREYLDNKYHDSLSLEEGVYRMVNSIDSHPLCPYCNKPVKFFSMKYGFLKTCDNKDCMHRLKADKSSFNDPKTQEKCKQTFLRKYGVINPFNQQQVIEHCRIASQSKETWQKRKNTNIKKYGADNPWKNKDVQDRIHDWHKLRYGNRCAARSDVGNKKSKETCMQKYGVECYQHTKEFKDLQRKLWKDPTHIHKRERTNIIKYGDPHYNNQSLRWETMKRNGTYGKSKTEDYAFIYLQLEYPNTKRQYKSTRYPYHADFYIPELDVYIECQFYYTHGGHPFNENSKEDLELLDNIKSKFESNGWSYKNYIRVWTELDPLKREIAKKNNIKLLEFWTLDELIEWLQ